MEDSRRLFEAIAFVQRDFPIGTIQAWSGSIVNIPSRWRLCNGTNGTPDLRDKFINCAGNLYAPADTGGNLTHTHTFTSDLHMHFLPSGNVLALGADLDLILSMETASGTADAKSSLPPYHSLSLIMYTGVP